MTEVVGVQSLLDQAQSEVERLTIRAQAAERKNTKLVRGIDRLTRALGSSALQKFAEGELVQRQGVIDSADAYVVVHWSADRWCVAGSYSSREVAKMECEKHNGQVLAVYTTSDGFNALSDLREAPK